MDNPYGMMSRQNDDAALSQRIDSIIQNNSYGQIQDYRRVDFSSKIPNQRDREFTQAVVRAIFDLEPDNNHLKLDMSARLGSTIIVWAEGLVGNVDLKYYASVMNLTHPVPGFKGIGKVYMAPRKPGNPERFVVEINSCVGKEQATGGMELLQLDRRHERRGRSRHRDPRDASPVRRRSPSLSPSPPPRRRSTRNLPPPRRGRSYSSSSSSSSSSDSSDSGGGGLFSTLKSLVT